MVGACGGGNPRTRWWTPEVEGTIRLKKESYPALLAGGTLEAVLSKYLVMWTQYRSVEVKRAEHKSKALNLLVDLHPYTRLWSRALANN